MTKLPSSVVGHVLWVLPSRAHTRTPIRVYHTAGSVVSQCVPQRGVADCHGGFLYYPRTRGCDACRGMVDSYDDAQVRKTDTRRAAARTAAPGTWASVCPSFYEGDQARIAHLSCPCVKTIQNRTKTKSALVKMSVMPTAAVVVVGSRSFRCSAACRGGLRFFPCAGVRKKLA